MSKAIIFTIAALTGLLLVPAGAQSVFGPAVPLQPATLLSNPTIDATAIPDWVDQNFRWYGEGLIAQSELVNAIKYLIDEEIMVIDTPTASSGDSLRNDLAAKGIVIVNNIPSDLAAKGIIIVETMPDQRATGSSLRGDLEARGIVIVNNMPSDLEAKGIIIVETMPSDSLRGDLEARGIVIVNNMPSDVAEKGIIIVTGTPSELAARGIVIYPLGTSPEQPRGEYDQFGRVKVQFPWMMADFDFASETVDDILRKGGGITHWDDEIDSLSQHVMSESGVTELEGIVVLFNNAIDKKAQSIDAELKILEQWLEMISKEQESSSYDASGRLTSGTTEATVQYRESDFDFISRTLGSIDQEIKALDTGIMVLEEKLQTAEDMTQIMQLQLQDAMNKQQLTLQTLSNIMKSQHDTLKAIINNMR